MKKIIVLLFAVMFIMLNCKTSSTTVHRSRLVTIPLAEAAYDIGQETSAKVCNYELGWFNGEGVAIQSNGAELTTAEYVPTILTGGLYWVMKEILIASGGYGNFTVEGAAFQRAIKKTDGDIMFEAKTTTQIDGFFFPDVCVTVSGKAAKLTGPSVNATAKK
ncbi:hypothetical protein AB3N58_03060 [Leptospira sp. WS60.C2]